MIRLIIDEFNQRLANRICSLACKAMRTYGITVVQQPT